MKKRISKRLSAVEPSITYTILDMVKALRARGVDVLDMGGGEPDFATPSHITNAAQQALQHGETHYTASRGDPALLAAIAEKLQSDNGIVVDPQRAIIVTPSAKHALFISLLALLDQGDEIIVPTPSWVSYKSMAQIAGARVVELPLNTANQFRLERKSLEARITRHTRAILINTPNNPTGRVLTAEETHIIADVAYRHDLIIIADEIYEKIIYDLHLHISIASLPTAKARTLTINGFSKAYAMTGWRLGYVAGPDDLIDSILKLQQHSVGCAGSFIQKGGIAALSGDQLPLQKMLASYDARRQQIVSGLNSIPGIQCTMPEGTFYAFANISQIYQGDATEFSRWLLQYAGIAVTPGSAFGSGGEGHIRLSFATSAHIIDDALERLRKFCQAH